METLENDMFDALQLLLGVLHMLAGVDNTHFDYISLFPDFIQFGGDIVGDYFHLAGLLIGFLVCNVLTSYPRSPGPVKAKRARKKEKAALVGKAALVRKISVSG
jgi:hypothetical protein